MLLYIMYIIGIELRRGQQPTATACPVTAIVSFDSHHVV